MQNAGTTHERLQLLKANLDRLLRSYQAVQRENDLLKQQLDTLRRAVSDKNKKIEGLEQQMELQRTAAAVAGNAQSEDAGAEREAMRKRINELIKEVDQCIALLNE